MTKNEPNTRSQPPDDPIVEEVRAIRRRFWEQAGRDIHNFVERARASTRTRRTSLPPKRDAG